MANEHVEQFSYRIEFQVRGLPHLHGVFWLNKSWLEDCLNGNEFDDAPVKLIGHFINQWISCSLDTGDKNLNDLVKKVNVHKQTKSCQRGNKICRFDFPKLPSNRTLIAKPLPEEEKGKTECVENI